MTALLLLSLLLLILVGVPIATALGFSSPCLLCRAGASPRGYQSAHVERS